MIWRSVMLIAASAFALAAAFCAVSVFAASPVNVTLSPEIVNVTVEQEGASTVTVTTSVGEVMNIVTAGEQGIRGPAGPGVPAGGAPGQLLGKTGYGNYSTGWVDPPQGGGVSSWNDIPDKPATFPPEVHNQGIDTITGLQGALDGKAELGGEVYFSNAHFNNYGGIEVGDDPTFKTTISMSSIATGQLSGTWLGLFNSSNKVHVQDVIDSVGHTHLFGNAHNMDASQLPGLHIVATSGSYNDLGDKPVFLRGYDGREIELQTTATHIQWRYKTDPPSPWTDLVPLSTLTGTDGDNYGCYITGGVTAVIYDKNGSNPAPTMQPFGVELRVNGSVVTPATWSWSVPAGSVLSGSAAGSTFTPGIAGTFSVGTASNRVDVTVTYAGITCKASAPVAVTRVGADGQAADAQNKQEIYTLLGAATTGDVLNTECGPGDAASFAGRTVRAAGGDIHRTDLCGGQTWIHARPSDAATAAKFGLKNPSGIPVMQFNADGSFTGTLVIR